jgi:hypothetical protein
LLKGTNPRKKDHFMRAIYLAPALLLAAFAFTPASAAPAAPIQASAAKPVVTLAQYKEERHDHHHHQHYVAGHRYRSAPHGWHRYHRRPHDWHTRGCILVGPIWFCP